MSVVPVEGVWIVANFKETQLSRMRVGQLADVAVDGYPDVEIRGIVDSLAPASGAVFSLLPPDTATGNFTKIVQRVPVKRSEEHTSELQSLMRTQYAVFC